MLPFSEENGLLIRIRTREIGVNKVVCEEIRGSKVSKPTYASTIA